MNADRPMSAPTLELARVELARIIRLYDVNGDSGPDGRDLLMRMLFNAGATSEHTDHWLTVAHAFAQRSAGAIQNWLSQPDTDPDVARLLDHLVTSYSHTGMFPFEQDWFNSQLDETLATDDHVERMRLLLTPIMFGCTLLGSFAMADATRDMIIDGDSWLN